MREKVAREVGSGRLLAPEYHKASLSVSLPHRVRLGKERLPGLQGLEPSLFEEIDHLGHRVKLGRLVESILAPPFLQAAPKGTVSVNKSDHKDPRGEAHERLPQPPPS